MKEPNRLPLLRRILMPLLIAALAVLGLSALAAVAVRSGPEPFVTWEGIGPDKWGTVWLIRRHVDPNAPIEFLPVQSPVDRGIAFDLPHAGLNRTRDKTTFESIIETYALGDGGINELAAIINDLEISRWQIRSFTESAQVETAYRLLQRRHGRENVPFPCYLQFFDAIYDQLSDGGADLASVAPEALLPSEDCALGRETARTGALLVPELSAQEILGQMAQSQAVVFVDTRESDEFAEGHIPGAVNIRLRDVNRHSASALKNADLVVPYCVKDFRGFEVARALQKIGVDNVAIMNPYGIKGWRLLDLPVEGTMALAPDDADREMRSCLEDVGSCLGQRL